MTLRQRINRHKRMCVALYLDGLAITGIGGLLFAEGKDPSPLAFLPLLGGFVVFLVAT